MKRKLCEHCGNFLPYGETQKEALHYRKRIFEFLQSVPYASNEEITTVVGIPKTKTTQYHLSAMVHHEILISQHGQPKGKPLAHYYGIKREE